MNFAGEVLIICLTQMIVIFTILRLFYYLKTKNVDLNKIIVAKIKKDQIEKKNMKILEKEINFITLIPDGFLYLGGNYVKEKEIEIENALASLIEQHHIGKVYIYVKTNLLKESEEFIDKLLNKYHPNVKILPSFFKEDIYLSYTGKEIQLFICE